MYKIKSFLYTILKIGILMILILSLGMIVIYTVEKISNVTSNMDSVVIVSLITGGVSVVTVIISSVISRFIEYKQTIKKYLYEKREKPYSEFIALVYKLQISQKNGETYTQEEVLKDISKFSELLTLWGSSNVIKKWIKFRENLLESSLVAENLF